MPKSFLDFLAEQNLIVRERAKELDKEGETSRESIGDLILKKRLMDEDKLLELQSHFFNQPIQKLAKGEAILPAILRQIPEDTARFYKIVPLKLTDGALEVGILDPEDLGSREALKFIGLKLRKTIKTFLVSRQDFGNILRDYRTLRGEVTEALKEIAEEVEIKPEVGMGLPEKKAAEMAEEAPVTKIVSVILRHAVEGKASDIHIEPDEESLRVRFRLDGILYTSLILPIKIHPAVAARIKILSGLKIDETRVPQDGRFRAKLNDRDIDFRVSTFPTIFGEKVVLRILDPSLNVKALESLGIEARNKDILMDGIAKPFGLILITGPTGSGKSTTLYLILNLLNREALNVVTIEDPVEYWIEGVNQSQVRPALGYTFASGLRNILRQDPDIIMVGEIRDEETAELVTHASLTGHLVFSTLHTNNVVGVIPRLIDMGVPPFLVSSSLTLMVAQRLVRRLCDECKEKVKPSPALEKIISENLAEAPRDILEEFKISKPYFVWEAKGCKACGFKGARGRVGIFEVFKMTKEFEKIILEKLSESAIMGEAKRQGMLTMRQDGILKALRGMVSPEEVLRETE